MPPHHKSSCKPCCEKKSKSHCAKSDVKRHDFRDCFAPREQQLLDDPSNTRVFNIDLRRAAKALFRVKYNNPEAVLNLFVYNENAYFTGQLAVGQPALAQQLATTFFQDVSGNSPLEVKISTGHFLPGRYTVRVVVVSSPTPVAFKLSVYEKRVCECVTVTPQDHQLCGFWQAEAKGYLYHFHIIKRCDGKLYAEQYFGHRTSGFQKINLNYYNYSLLVPPYPVLEEYTPGVYRYQPNPLYDLWNYFNIDQTNQDGLLYSQGGSANPVMTISIYYTRLENWRNYVVDFNNPGDYQSPPKQLNIFTNQILNNFNIQVNTAAESSDYPGLGEFLNMRDQLLTTGITTEHQGTDIWPEPVDFNYFSIPVNNPITTYVPVTLKDVELLISPDFGGYVAYYNPDNQYEVGMTIKLSGVKTANQIGIANEWLNTYFLFAGFDGEWCYLTPIRIGSNYPITALITVAELKVTPYSFKFTHNLGFPLTDEYNNNNAYLVTFSGYSSVGGLDASIINRRYTTAYSPNNISSFYTLPPGTSDETDPIATIAETGGGSGILAVAVYPYSARTLNMYNYNSIHLNPDPITLFFTEDPVLANSNTQVEISNLIGDYEKYNGIHNVHWFTNGSNMKNNKEVWKEGFDSKDRRYYTPVAVDSTNTPSYNQATHSVDGKGYKLRLIVNQVKENSGYGDFAAAISYLYNQLGCCTHGLMHVYADYIRGLRNPSWKSIQEVVGMNVSPINFVYSRGLEYQSATYYTGTYPVIGKSYLNELNKDAYNNTPGAPINPGLRFDPSYPTYVNIGNQALKYIDLDNAYNVYAKISGQTLNERVPGSDPLNQNISNDLITLGANANGTIIDYETHRVGEIIPFGVSLTTPVENRYALLNAFANDGFVPETVPGELILANPIQATGPLQADCNGKIVVTLRGVAPFADKLANAYAAGAIAVIVFNNVPGPLTSVTTNGYNPGIPIYTMSGVDGNLLTGFMGGSPLDVTNYAMPTTAPTGYVGEIGFLPIPERRLLITSENFMISKIKDEFSNGKKIGYVNIPESYLVTNLRLEPKYEFWDIYGVSNFIDNRAKLWSVILQTVIDGVKLSEMDSIVFNNANNLGGFGETWAALGSFFGTDRQTFGIMVCLADDGLSPVTPLDVYVKKFPENFPLVNQLLTVTYPITATETQAQYPDAAFKGKKVVHLTSTVAFSSGDLYTHFFRNHAGSNSVEYQDIGNGIKSIIIGTVDGRDHGFLSTIFGYSMVTRNSQFYSCPSINSQYVPITSYDLQGDAYAFFSDAYSGNSVSNQLPYIAVDGLNNTGPLNAFSDNDAGYYQATGFATPYERNTPQYQIFNDAIGLPTPYNISSIHYPWLEDAILTANQ